MCACRWDGPSRTAPVPDQWAGRGQRRQCAAGAADGIKRAGAPGPADGRAWAAGATRCSARHATRWAQAWCPIPHCSRHGDATGKWRGTQCRSAVGMITACLWVMLLEELHGLLKLCFCVLADPTAPLEQPHSLSLCTLAAAASLHVSSCDCTSAPAGHRMSAGQAQHLQQVHSMLVCSCLCITASATFQLVAPVACRPSCSSL